LGRERERGAIILSFEPHECLFTYHERFAADYAHFESMGYFDMKEASRYDVE
jgi:hypothetical protein